MPKHQHFLYILGLQHMSGDTLPPLVICLKELIEEETKHLGIFYHISGNKHFCAYALVYDKLSRLLAALT